MRSFFVLLLLCAAPVFAEITDVRIHGNELWVENKVTEGVTHNGYETINLYTSGDSYRTNTKKMWRDVYGAVNGKIIYLRKVEAKITPAKVTHTEEPERIEWPK